MFSVLCIILVIQMCTCVIGEVSAMVCGPFTSPCFTNQWAVDMHGGIQQEAGRSL